MLQEDDLFREILDGTERSLVFKKKKPQCPLGTGVESGSGPCWWSLAEGGLRFRSPLLAREKLAVRVHDAKAQHQLCPPRPLPVASAAPASARR